MADKFGLLAERIFSIFKGTGHTLRLFDEQGNQTIDPENARHFFAVEDRIMVTLHQDNADNNELTLMIPEKNDKGDVRHFADMIRSLRRSAQHFNIMFTVRKFGHEITPKDVIHKIKESWSNDMEIAEQMNPKMTGTSRTSHQKWNEARLIVKHSKVVNEEQRGARSRNISRLFVETAEGERFLFPTKNLQAARAWCRHLGAGGVANDIVSEHIKSLSNEMETLKEFSAHIFRNRTTLEESALAVRSSARTRIDEIRNELGRFMTKRAYFTVAEEIESSETSGDTLVESHTDLSERLEWLSDTLAIAEDHDLYGKLSSLVEFTEPAVADEEPMEGQFTPDDVAQAYEFRGADNAARDPEGTFDWEAINKDTPPEHKDHLKPPAVERLYFEEAAALLNTNDFTFFDKYTDDDANKPDEWTPRGKLAWRLASIAKRLDPKVKGQLVLSNILSYVADKMQEGARPNPQAQRIAGHFITNIAPTIHESISVRLAQIEESVKLGESWLEDLESAVNDLEAELEAFIDNDSEYGAVDPLIYDMAQAYGVDVASLANAFHDMKGIPPEDFVFRGRSFGESRELDEWFEGFDPLRIIKESSKKLTDDIPVIPGDMGKDFEDEITTDGYDHGEDAQNIINSNDEIDTEMYEEVELANGMKVKFTPDYAGNDAGEVFTLTGWDGKRGRVEDSQGRGWGVSGYQIEPAFSSQDDDYDDDSIPTQGSSRDLRDINEIAEWAADAVTDGRMNFDEAVEDYYQDNFEESGIMIGKFEQMVQAHLDS